MSKFLSYFLVLFPVILSHTARSQYVPPLRTLKFRLYGENAKPIMDTGKQYALHISPDSGRDEMYFNSTLFMHCRECGRVKFEIVHNGIPMRLSLPPADFDSIIYQPGNYNVPDEYAFLFQAGALSGSKIINQNLSLFKVDDIDSTPEFNNITYTPVLNDYQVTGWTKLTRGTTVLIGYKEPYLYLLINKNKSRTSWKIVPLNLAGKTYSSIWGTALPLNNKEFYLVANGGYNLSVPGFIKTDISGKEWVADSFLGDSLGDYNGYYSLYYSDKGVGYAMGLNHGDTNGLKLEYGRTSKINFGLNNRGPDTLVLYKTTDVGDHWKIMLVRGIKGYYAHIGKFVNADMGYIYSFKRNYPNVTDTSSLVFYVTHDGYKTWTRYIPQEKEFNGLTDEYIPALNWNSQYMHQYYFYVFNRKDSKIYRIATHLNLNEVIEQMANPPIIAAFGNKEWAMVFSYFMLVTKDNCKSWGYIPFGDLKGYTAVTGAEFVNEHTIILYTWGGIYKMSFND